MDVSTAHTENFGKPCPTKDAQEYTSKNLSPEPKIDLNYEHTNSSDALFRSDNQPMPDLLPLEPTFDVDQTGSLSNQPPTLAGSCPPSATASMMSRTPLKAGLPASASQANTSEAFSEPARNDSVRYVAISKAPAFTCEACLRERPQEPPSSFPPMKLLQCHEKSHVRFACTSGCAETFSIKKDRTCHVSNIKICNS